MNFLWRNRFALLFFIVVDVCAVLIIRQVNANQYRHVELREAFLLLQSTGHEPQAKRLYERLVRELETQTLRALLDDRQRLVTLVDPAKDQPESLIWRYHRSVANELEKRAQSTLVRALKLAEESR